MTSYAEQGAQSSASSSGERAQQLSESAARDGHAELDANAGVRVGPNSYARSNANLRADSRNVLQKPEAFSITRKSWIDTSSAALQAHVGYDSHAVKRLARILECSPRTAENLLLGRTAPDGIHMLRAYAMIPEFAAEVRRLTAREQSLDPEFERDLANFMQGASRYFDRKGGGE